VCETLSLLDHFVSASEHITATVLIKTSGLLFDASGKPDDLLYPYGDDRLVGLPGWA